MKLWGPKGRSSAMSKDGKVRWDVNLDYNPRTKQGSLDVTATGSCGKRKQYSGRFKVVSSCEARFGKGARRRR
jgi:hypothetical protein